MPLKGSSRYGALSSLLVLAAVPPQWQHGNW
jgi:hypothetical protein